MLPPKYDGLKKHLSFTVFMPKLCNLILMIRKQQTTQKGVKVKLLSRLRLPVTPWTVACQTPLSMRFPRQEYRSGLPFPSQSDLPHPGIELRSLTLQTDSLPSETAIVGYFTSKF